MAKDLKDIRIDFERLVAFAMKALADDAKDSKIDVTEVDVTILQVLSHAICTMAYVGGMTKEEFLEAIGSSWDETKVETDKAKERLEKYMKSYQEAVREIAEACDCPDCRAAQEEDEDPLKN